MFRPSSLSWLFSRYFCFQILISQSAKCTQSLLSPCGAETPTTGLQMTQGRSRCHGGGPVPEAFCACALAKVLIPSRKLVFGFVLLRQRGGTRKNTILLHASPCSMRGLSGVHTVSKIINTAINCIKIQQWHSQNYTRQTAVREEILQPNLFSKRCQWGGKGKSSRPTLPRGHFPPLYGPSFVTPGWLLVPSCQNSRAKGFRLFSFVKDEEMIVNSVSFL